MMKKPKSILSGILGATVISAGALHGQSDVLMLVSDGHSSEQNVRDFGAWIESESGGQYSLSFSADFEEDVNVLDSAESLNEDQMNLLNSFDLIIGPRLGAGAASNYGSTDWNDVTTPILGMDANVGRSDEGWGWFSTTWTGNVEIDSVDVEDPTSPVFDGVDTSADSVTVLTSATGIRTPPMDPTLFNGTVVARMSNEEQGLDRAGIVMWDGTESAFFDGGTESPAARRTLFSSTTFTIDDSRWTEDGQQMFMNAVGSTIPEPGTYALFAGFGALGGVLLLRRMRRRKE